MAEKETKEPKAGKESDPQVIDLGNLSTFELIQIVAGIVEKEKGTHSEKHYRMLADELRALAHRL